MSSSLRLLQDCSSASVRCLLAAGREEIGASVVGLLLVGLECEWSRVWRMDELGNNTALIAGGCAVGLLLGYAIGVWSSESKAKQIAEEQPEKPVEEEDEESDDEDDEDSDDESGSDSEVDDRQYKMV